MWKPQEALQGLELKAGDYVVSIVDAFDGVSQSSGAEMTTVVFETEGEAPVRLWDHFVKSHPVAQRRMLALLGAVGLLDREKIETKDLIGKRLKVRIAVEKFQGLPQGRIKRFTPADEAQAK